jgi:hypothetical protein
VLVAGLVGPGVPGLVEHHGDAVVLEGDHVTGGQAVQGGGVVGGEEQQPVDLAGGERADPAGRGAVVDVAEPAGSGGHALPEGVGERRQLAVAHAEAGEAVVGQGHVHPLGRGHALLPTPPGTGVGEQPVEPEDLVRRGDLLGDGGQPRSGRRPIAEAQEQQALVVLVEPGQHVALDLGQIHDRVDGRIGGGRRVRRDGEEGSERAQGGPQAAGPQDGSAGQEGIGHGRTLCPDPVIALSGCRAFS